MNRDLTASPNGWDRRLSDLLSIVGTLAGRLLARARANASAGAAAVAPLAPARQLPLRKTTSIKPILVL